MWTLRVVGGNLTLFPRSPTSERSTQPKGLPLGMGPLRGFQLEDDIEEMAYWLILLIENVEFVCLVKKYTIKTTAIITTAPIR